MKWVLSILLVLLLVIPVQATVRLSQYGTDWSGRQHLYVSQAGAGLGDGTSVANAMSKADFDLEVWSSTPTSNSIGAWDVILIVGTITETIEIKASGVTHQEIEIKGAVGQSGTISADPAIDLNGYDYIYIIGITTTGGGIISTGGGSEYIRVDNCTIVAGSSGVVVDLPSPGSASDHIVIADNTLTGRINHGGGDNIWIKNNTVTNNTSNWLTFPAAGSGTALVENNIIYGSGSDIYAGGVTVTKRGNIGPSWNDYTTDEAIVLGSSADETMVVDVSDSGKTTNWKLFGGGMPPSRSFANASECAYRNGAADWASAMFPSAGGTESVECIPYNGDSPAISQRIKDYQTWWRNSIGIYGGTRTAPQMGGDYIWNSTFPMTQLSANAAHFKGAYEVLSNVEIPGSSVGSISSDTDVEIVTAYQSNCSTWYYNNIKYGGEIVGLAAANFFDTNSMTQLTYEFGQEPMSIGRTINNVITSLDSYCSGYTIPNITGWSLDDAPSRWAKEMDLIYDHMNSSSGALSVDSGATFLASAATEGFNGEAGGGTANGQSYAQALAIIQSYTATSGIHLPPSSGDGDWDTVIWNAGVTYNKGDVVISNVYKAYASNTRAYGYYISKAGGNIGNQPPHATWDRINWATGNVMAQAAYWATATVGSALEKNSWIGYALNEGLESNAASGYASADWTATPDDKLYKSWFWEAYASNEFAKHIGDVTYEIVGNRLPVGTGAKWFHDSIGTPGEWQQFWAATIVHYWWLVEALKGTQWLFLSDEHAGNREGYTSKTLMNKVSPYVYRLGHYLKDKIIPVTFTPATTWTVNWYDTSGVESGNSRYYYWGEVTDFPALTTIASVSTDGTQLTVVVVNSWGGAVAQPAGDGDLVVSLTLNNFTPDTKATYHVFRVDDPGVTRFDKYVTAQAEYPLSMYGHEFSVTDDGFGTAGGNFSQKTYIFQANPTNLAKIKIPESSLVILEFTGALAGGDVSVTSAFGGSASIQ